MIRGVFVITALLAGYAWGVYAAGGAAALALLAAPQLLVLPGKRGDPMGALMFALYAGMESALLAAVSAPITWLAAGTDRVLPIALLLLVINSMREVFRYLALDHFHPRSMRFGLACGCIAYCLMAGLVLL